MSKYLSYILIINCTLLGVLAAKDSKGQALSVNEIFLTIDLENKDLQEVFSSIEKQTGFTFTYFKSNIKNRKIDKIKKDNASLGEILRTISKEANVQFKRVNQNIYVNKKMPFAESIIEVNKDGSLADVDISGKITDENGEGLPGASIVEKGTTNGTTNGTTTDLDGNYKLSVPDDAVIAISFVGYVRQDIEIGSQSEINIQMVVDASELEELVVLGYAVKEKASITSAVASIQGDDVMSVGAPDLRQGLQGLTPGLNITDYGGAPGNENLSIRIRGITSLNSANPLILVDGVEQSLNSINPNTIQSITVLKDAASTAIYGSRGANGVILVTTKTGDTKSKLTVSYNGYQGIQSRALVPELASTEDFFTTQNLAQTNRAAPLPPDISDADMEAYLRGMQEYPDLYPEAYASNDLLTNSSAISNHSLSISGGTDKLSTFINYNYLSNKGWFETSDREIRNQLRLNNDLKITDRIKVFSKLFYEDRDYKGLNSSFATYFRSTYFPRDFFTGTAPDGAIISGPRRGSPLFYFEEDFHGVRRNKERTFVANFGGEIEITDYLTFSTNYSVKTINKSSSSNVPAYVWHDWWFEDQVNQSRSRNNLTVGNGETVRTSFNNLLKFNKDIGVHNFGALLGYTEDEFRETTNSITGFDIYSNDLQSLSGSEAESRNVSNGIQEWGLRSFLTSITYSYNNMIYLDLNGRYDGSSRFPKGNKYSFFPSAALAVRLDQIDFWSPLLDVVPSFKVRFSYGVTGNQNIGNYEYIDQLNLSNGYMFGGQLVNTVSSSTIASKELTWEKTSQWNAGIDAGLFEDKLGITLDVYNKTTEGILLRLPVTGVVGLQANRSNAGTVENKGFEFQSTWRDSKGEFSYDVSVNFSYNQDKLTDYAGLNARESFLGGQIYTAEGRPLVSTQGLIHDGYYKNQEEIDNGPVVTINNRTVIPGDSKFRDISGPEGEPDGLITNDDRIHLGSATPLYQYGLQFNAEYKNFFFGMSWQGSAKFTRLLTHPFAAVSAWPDHVILKVQAKDYWTPENLDSEWPAPHRTARQNIYPSTRLAKDASYVRLRNVTLGYSIPKQLIEKVKLTQVRVYISGRNPFIISKLANKYGMDPEGGSPGIRSFRGTYYQQTKSWSIGANITF